MIPALSFQKNVLKANYLPSLSVLVIRNSSENLKLVNEHQTYLSYTFRSILSLCT